MPWKDEHSSGPSGPAAAPSARATPALAGNANPARPSRPERIAETGACGSLSTNVSVSAGLFRLSVRREVPGSVSHVLARLVAVSSRRHVDPCMRFSRTRLTDALQRLHSDWPAGAGMG